jgi:hypothetical protein
MERLSPPSQPSVSPFCILSFSSALTPFSSDYSLTVLSRVQIE